MRKRRRARWFAVVSMSAAVAVCAANVLRNPDGPFIAPLCAVSLALVVNLVSFTPRVELRALRSEITHPPFTGAQARRWAFGGLVVGALVVAVALIVAALTGAWLTALGVTAPIALLWALWAFFVLRSARPSTDEP